MANLKCFFENLGFGLHVLIECLFIVSASFFGACFDRSLSDSGCNTFHILLCNTLKLHFFTCVHIYSVTVNRGRISSEAISKATERAQWTGAFHESDAVYACGPHGFMQAVGESVKALGLPGDRFKTESFLY